MDQTLRLRLKQRAREGEQTIEDVINRLLDETVVEITLEEVIEAATDEFEHICSITVAHPGLYEGPGIIDITLYTGDVETFGKHVQLFTPNHKIVINRPEEKIRATFNVVATCDGPVTWDSTESTTIYMKDNVIGAEPIDLEDGLAYLLDKLENPDQWSNDRSYDVDQIRNYSR